MKHLHQPAGKLIRHRTGRLLEKTDAAVGRLRDRADQEALHDTRVALRRLRGWCQAFREELDLNREQRHALRDLAHSTNDARDAEVGLEWLRSLQRQGGSELQAGIARFAADLEALRDASYRRVRKQLPKAWQRLRRKLKQRADQVEDSGPPFLDRFGTSALAYVRDFSSALEQARRTPVPPCLHALRIANKKLRYLVETLPPSGTAAAKLIREMKTLHDSAGAIQDLQRIHVLAEQCYLKQAGRRYRQLIATDPARPQPASARLEPLVWIGRAARREQDERIARFRRTYLSGPHPVDLRELQQFLRRLKVRT